MPLAISYVGKHKADNKTLLKNNVRFRVIGSREGLAPEVLDELDRTCEESAKCTGLQLNIALNYGSRQEIIDAVSKIRKLNISYTLQHIYIKGIQTKYTLNIPHKYTLNYTIFCPTMFSFKQRIP